MLHSGRVASTQSGSLVGSFTVAVQLIIITSLFGMTDVEPYHMHHTPTHMDHLVHY